MARNSIFTENDLEYGSDEKILNYLHLNKSNSFICTKHYGQYRLPTYVDPQKFVRFIEKYKQLIDQ